MLQLNFNPKKTTRLFGLENEFNFLKKMISSDKFPKTLMLTGNRGVGKSTMISHLMHYYFAKKTYNENENTFANGSSFKLPDGKHIKLDQKDFNQMDLLMEWMVRL